ncbi:unnamed protein product [Rotaria sordida]|uniref:N-acetyltransferase domain-containing protein n=1 Tax=Rotaria sordida TaxID=392033 RepID=A0A814QE99_9BILA|nr:unnamed protein product [Rotaria sordida]
MIGWCSGRPTLECNRTVGDEIYDCEVGHMFILKEYQHCGIGRELWKIVWNEILIRFHPKNLIVWSLNKEQAHHFYLSLGGALFQIDSCEHNSVEDLGHIKLHATDLDSEYIEYQKKRMTKSNVLLFFDNLLLEMGEYPKAKRHFDRILRSSNPNDEEIACIFFNFGRIHRLHGNFHRAIDCYNRAYKLHMDARPERLGSAGKCLNDLGIVYSEMGRQIRAEECFQGAMELYKISSPNDPLDIAGTLIHLGAIDCDRRNLKEALDKYQEAIRIYDSCLSPDHPSRARARVGLGNVHVASENYTMALQEYESTLKLQQAFLPADHEDIGRTLHNLAIVHTHLGNKDEAKKYSERANEIADQIPSLKHSFSYENIS